MALEASTAGAWRERLLLALPPLLCSLIFTPCLTYSEWYIDELFAVLRNEDARGTSTLQQVFTNDFWGNPLYGGGHSWTHKSYRPLCVLSFAWQFKLLGHDLFRPQPLRAFNVALHAVNSLLVLVLLRSSCRFSRWWSCLVACLFAAHPVHVENVVYLVGRADMLATTGWLVATLAYLRVRRTRGLCGAPPPRPLAFVLLLVLSALLAVASGLCKESGLTLLVFLAGIELTRQQAAPLRGTLCALSMLGAFAALAVLRMRITRGTSANFGFVDTPVQYHPSWNVRAWSYLFQHAYYMKLLVLPGDLSWDYSYDALPMLRATWRDVRTLAVCATYLGLCAVASWSLAGRRRRADGGTCRQWHALLGLQHALVPFVPASNLFFIVGVTVGERLLYPPSVGAALVAAALAEHTEESPSARPPDEAAKSTAATEPRRRSRRSWPSALAVLLLGIYVYRCARRVWQWHSSEALYAADAAAFPRSVKTRHQLGTVYHAEGRYEEALRHFEASLEVLDDNALTDHCIAQIYIETGRYGLALERFEKMLHGNLVGFSRFNLYMLYVDYGFTLVALKRFDEAIEPLTRGLDLNLDVPHGLNALGYAYARLERLQEAHDAFAKGLEYDPENAILWNNLAAIFMVAGQLQPAATGLERALLLEPQHGIIVHNAMLLKEAAATGQLIAMPQLAELFFSRTG